MLEVMHYTDYIDQINGLLKNKDHREAEVVLLRCVDLTEKESSEENCGVAPWYYEQLAILYRKEKRTMDEIAILEQFCAQRKAPGVKPAKLKERLVKARSKLENQ